MLDVKCWTTPGVGDFMLSLNRLHLIRHRSKMPMRLEMNWYHDEDFLYHFEEEETIVERFKVIHNLYRHSNKVYVTHKFNSQDELLRKQKWRWNPPQAERPRLIHDNEWSFALRCMNRYGPVNKNKVVIWRPLFNAERARDWKWVVSNDMWEEAIDYLKQLGYTIVELEYRTPIREVFYHIATCNFVVCYDGMWHYVAKNAFKPMIVTSRSTITKYHTPYAMMLSELDRIPQNNFLYRIKNLHNFIPEDDQTTYQRIYRLAARGYEDYTKRYDAYRPSRN